MTTFGRVAPRRRTGGRDARPAGSPHRCTGLSLVFIYSYVDLDLLESTLQTCPHGFADTKENRWLDGVR
jgi:hypothetical protein